MWKDVHSLYMIQVTDAEIPKATMPSFRKISLYVGIFAYVFPRIEVWACEVHQK